MITYQNNLRFYIQYMIRQVDVWVKLFFQDHLPFQWICNLPSTSRQLLLEPGRLIVGSSTLSQFNIAIENGDFYWVFQVFL